ncbi:hypothetical protein DEU56DRAFT_945527 [Suillus clintonianus]|uniref:uncharacterized protein n=1 Tax=Suillus clintonianus TaxID=1904413 RepID=UPI001B86C7F3|nr:uncharacterized protein DEU56DRAFT_945527 [Suillus clintonianus]KAG2137913.1 hypothetical protein DEU56DRAFT_945527 [Suillus clintonianus]
MQAIDRMTANSKANSSPLLDMMGALQTMLASSEVTIPDLETPCSRFPNTDQSATHTDQSVCAIITERQQQLDIVLREISGLKTMMDSIKNLEQQLVVKKDRITESMNLHKGLLSGLWRLPTEILSQIFHQCLPKSTPLSKPRALLLLTRVCRRWREVVICIPSLWCRLYMEVSWRNRWEREGPIYDSWLKRSQGRPVSLAVFCQKDDAAKIQSLIHPYISQITSLFIKFYGDADLLLLDDLPALQEFAIQMVPDEDDSNGCIPAIEQSFWRLPSTLRSLKVVDEELHQVPLSSLGPVGAHLTNLDISTLRRPSAVLHLLQLCPNLSSLKISLFTENGETLEPFMHTKIQTFRIEHYCHIIQPFSDLFNALSLPSLRILEVHYVYGERCPHAVLKAFLARSKCPLESLVFSRGNVVTDVERAEYSTLIPSLNILLEANVPGDGFFH